MKVLSVFANRTNQVDSGRSSKSSSSSSDDLSGSRHSVQYNFFLDDNHTNQDLDNLRTVDSRSWSKMVNQQNGDRSPSTSDRVYHGDEDQEMILLKCISQPSPFYNGDNDDDEVLKTKRYTDHVDDYSSSSSSSSNSHQQGQQEYKVYHVQSCSETLQSVAAKFRTTPTLIKTVNKLSNNFIFVGQCLKLPDPMLSTGHDHEQQPQLIIF